MKNEFLSRTEILLGKEKIEKINKARVTIVGLGGVGSYAAESLIRAGICEFQLIDFDTVSLSNINRQILATHKTIGLLKTDVMKDRMLDINPEAKIFIYSEFLHKDNRLEILKNSDYIIDAIDSIGPKMGMLKDLCEMNIPFVSVLGAGNRISPEFIKITSIWNTHGCPFAKRIKKLLKKVNVTKDFPVVFSEEKPIKLCDLQVDNTNFTGTHIPKSLVGSISYMPAIMGMMAASKVIREILLMDNG